MVLPTLRGRSSRGRLSSRGLTVLPCQVPVSPLPLAGSFSLAAACTTRGVLTVVVMGFLRLLGFNGPPPRTPEAPRPLLPRAKGFLPTGPRSRPAPPPLPPPSDSRAWSAVRWILLLGSLAAAAAGLWGMWGLTYGAA